MAKDYYDILGIARSANAEEIKRAYREKAHAYHPDRDGGDEEKFKEVNEAYQTLKDDQKRAQYDQFGQTFGGGGPQGGFGGFDGVNVNFEDLGGFGDIFEQFFGGGGGRTRTRERVRRGEDVAIDVTIPFIESATKATRKVTHRLRQKCEHCQGNGAEPGTPIKTCSTCQGTGVVTSTHQTPFGVFAQNTACTTCSGEGKQPETPCATCRGEGRQLKERTLEITIPAGIADGQTIRLSGKGEVAPRGGVAGDLYVRVHVKPHGQLSRDGNDVRYEAVVSYPDAVLGTTVTVPSLTGEETVTIPPGTQPGAELRLRGKGMPVVQGGGVGDQVITVRLEVPKRVSREQRKLLEQLRHSKKKKGLFS